jgi:hypothetical protein
MATPTRMNSMGQRNAAWSTDLRRIGLLLFGWHDDPMQDRRIQPGRTVLHAIEGTVWAVAYRVVGARCPITARLCSTPQCDHFLRPRTDIS